MSNTVSIDEYLGTVSKGPKVPSTFLSTSGVPVDAQGRPITPNPTTQSSFNIGNILNKGTDAISGAFSSMFGGNTLANTAGMDPKAYANLGQLEQLNAQKAFDLGTKNAAANSFDFTGAFNTGLSAFNTYTQSAQQNEMMDLYKTDLNKKWADQDRRDTTRANWGSAFKNTKATL